MERPGGGGWGRGRVYNGDCLGFKIHGAQHVCLGIRVSMLGHGLGGAEAWWAMIAVNTLDATAVCVFTY